MSAGPRWPPLSFPLFSPSLISLSLLCSAFCNAGEEAAATMASHEADGCAEEGGDETHEAATGEGYARAAGQPLLVPLKCGCPSRSPNAYSPMQYQINAGDTFWIVSTTKLQNLKQYQAVERVNPTLVPTNLGIGQIDMFPAACSPPFPAACSPPFVAAAWSPPSERCRCLVAGGRRQQHQTYPINYF
nr:uncharacterized protein LOC4338975 [Oryza sativa Japonica Group]